MALHNDSSRSVAGKPLIEGLFDSRRYQNLYAHSPLRLKGLKTSTAFAYRPQPGADLRARAALLTCHSRLGALSLVARGAIGITKDSTGTRLSAAFCGFHKARRYVVKWRRSLIAPRSG